MPETFFSSHRCQWLCLRKKNTTAVCSIWSACQADVTSLLTVEQVSTGLPNMTLILVLHWTKEVSQPSVCHVSSCFKLKKSKLHKCQEIITFFGNNMRVTEVQGKWATVRHPISRVVPSWSCESVSQKNTVKCLIAVPVKMKLTLFALYSSIPRPFHRGNITHSGVRQCCNLYLSKSLQAKTSFSFLVTHSYRFSIQADCNVELLESSYAVQ